MSLAKKLETYVTQLVDVEVERTKLLTELFWNPKLRNPKTQRHHQQAKLMSEKADLLFEKSKQIRQNLFGYDEDFKEVE